MKTIPLLLLSMTLSTQAHAIRGTYVEIPLQKVFIPEQGYDDNDPVGIVVSGELPNPCYTLSATSVTPTPDGSAFEVKQIAWKQMIGPCASGDLIDDPVPFTAEVALGQLQARRYELIYSGEPAKRRPFEVAHAPVAAMDNFDYAIVRSIEMAPIQYPGRPLRATLSGVLTSTCMEIAPAPKVERVGDVTVVLPILKRNDGPCQRELRAFSETVELGPYAPGSYLLHVRTRDGKAVNHVFEVLAFKR